MPKTKNAKYYPNGKSKEAVAAYNRQHALKRYYGLSVEQYNLMLEVQNGICAICSRTCHRGKRLVVDHCHKTQRLRGLLCSNCNSGIGLLDDNPELLENASRYLRR